MAGNDMCVAIIPEVKGQKKLLDRLGNQIGDLVRMHQYMQSDSSFQGVMDVDTSLNSVDDFIRDYTGYDGIRGYRDQPQDKQSTDHLQSVIDAKTKVMAEAGVDFWGAKSKLDLSEDFDRLARIGRRNRWLTKTATATHHLTSLKFLTGGMVEAFTDFHKVNSTHPITGPLYARYQLMRQYVQQKQSELVHMVDASTK